MSRQKEQSDPALASHGASNRGWLVTASDTGFFERAGVVAGDKVCSPTNIPLTPPRRRDADRSAGDHCRYQKRIIHKPRVNGRESAIGAVEGRLHCTSLHRTKLSSTALLIVSE